MQNAKSKESLNVDGDPCRSVTPAEIAHYQEFGCFVSGSHRLGVLGNYRTYAQGEDLLDIYPDLREDQMMSEPMTYAAGDITVHSHMLAHGAGANLTDRPRWAYIMGFQPADACWTGAPAEAYDHTGLVINMPLPDDRFPILAS